MRLTDVHGALAAAYGRSAGQVAGKRKVESGSGADQQASGQTEAASSPTTRVADFTQGVEKFMQSLGVQLKFNVSDSGEVQAEVRHTDGGKVIRKIPPDEVLELAESIKKMTGAFLDKAF
jgi:flagellar protein FlaG